jgi:hypothetical protein
LEIRDGRRNRVPVHVQQCERLVRRERQHAREHPEEDHPERVDVARRADRLGAGLFG